MAPGARSKFVPPCSKLRSFEIKFAVLKKVLVTLLGFVGGPRSDSAPGGLFPLAPSLRPSAHRLASASYYTAADFVQYGVRNCESTLMQLWKFFTVSLAMHQTTMKTKGRQLQRACKTRWLSSVATLRARGEILAIWAALKQLSENKNDAIGVVLLRLIKTKSFNMVSSFCQHWHLTRHEIEYVSLQESTDQKCL